MSRFLIQIAIWSALASSAAAAPDGAALYKAQCVACHGPAAGGNAALQAPPLAGFDEAYLARQLRGFRAGHRGGEGAAPTAQAMRAVAQALSGDDAINALARHLARAKTPAAAPGPATAAQLNLGKSLFGVCVACHGGAGEGNAELQAPRISQLPAWYVAAQLTAYRSGTRGAEPQDTLGRQMRQVANEALGSPEEVEAVASHVANLKPLRPHAPR